MAWIEAQQSLRSHPKLMKLSRLLGDEYVSTVGRLVLFWNWCLDYAEDGHLDRYSAAELATAASWDGPPEQFQESMINCGLIDAEPLRIHDWLDYAGLYLIRKYSTLHRKKLVAIWSGYNLRYGAGHRRAVNRNSNRNGRRTSSEQKESLPLPTYTRPRPTIPEPNLPTATTADTNARAREEGEPDIPDPKTDPAKALVVYFKVLKGIPWEDAQWNEDWMGIYIDKAKALLARAGDYNTAYECLEHYGAEWNAKGFKDWKFDGIIKRVVEWKAAHKKGAAHGRSNVERFFDALDRQRASRKSEGLRSASETVSNLLRNGIPGAEGEAGEPIGSGHKPDERTSAPVLEKKAG